MGTMKHVADAVPVALKTLKRWRLIDVNYMDGTIHLEHDTPVIRYTDDIYLYMRVVDDTVRVSGKSASRVGAWDLGVNRRNLQSLLSALDDVLTPCSATT